ncbi:hypothetical protein LQW54_005272 [Pestalotiopsis sp. IQ-011]
MLLLYQSFSTPLVDVLPLAEAQTYLEYFKAASYHLLPFYTIPELDQLLHQLYGDEPETPGSLQTKGLILSMIANGALQTSRTALAETLFARAKFQMTLFEDTVTTLVVDLSRLAHIAEQGAEAIYGRRYDSLRQLYHAAESIHGQLKQVSELIGIGSAPQKSLSDPVALQQLHNIYYHTIILTFRPFIIAGAAYNPEGVQPLGEQMWLRQACRSAVDAAQDLIMFSCTKIRTVPTCKILCAVESMISKRSNISTPVDAASSLLHFPNVQFPPSVSAESPLAEQLIHFSDAIGIGNRDMQAPMMNAGTGDPMQTSSNPELNVFTTDLHSFFPCDIETPASS